MSKRSIRAGDIVQPSHTGEDTYRRANRWQVYKGRVLSIYSEGNRSYAVMAWFRDAKDVMPRSYPVDLLEVSA